MNWGAVRGGLYVTALGAALAMVAYVLQAAGYGRYDEATGLFYPEPVDVRAVTAWLLANVTAPAVAFVALVRGWGRK